MNEIAQVVRIYAFPALPREMLARISAGRTEASKVWMKCRDLHQAARVDGTKWPNRDSLQRATKGHALHSQSTQMVCHAFLANVQTTRELKSSGHHKARYPYKDKRYYPLLWPAQAVSVTKTTIVLPMGRGRASIVLPKPEGFVIGGCKLVWSGSANELHVTTEVAVSAPIESSVVATVDLGQIHQAAVTTNTGAGLIVSGRGQRSLKRRMNMMHGEIARLQSRCKKGSRRWKKLARARHAKAGRIERQVRDLAHKGTTAVIDFCRAHDVSRIFVGDPHGVRRNKNGRKHNQRMAQWEYGRDKRYLNEKSQRAGMTCFTGSERGTSSRCPSCGHKHKPRGRVWHCKACGFTGHRDLVGSVNMHEDNFEKLTEFPSLRDVTYLRPGNALLRLGLSRSNEEAAAPGVNNLAPGSSSRPDTGHGEASMPLVPALLSEPHPNTAVPDICPSRAPQGAGHWVGLQQKPIPFRGLGVSLSFHSSLTKGVQMEDLKEMLRQQAELQARIEEVRKAQRADAIKQIIDLMALHDLKPADIGIQEVLLELNEKGRPVLAPMYKGPNGETWGGMGRRPNWLRALAEAGEDLKKFRVQLN